MRNFEYFAGGTNEGGETPPTIEEVHEKKLIGYLNNDGDLDYVKGDHGKEWSDVTDEDKAEVLKKFAEDKEGMRKLEKELLSGMPLPTTSEHLIFQSFENKDDKKVLSYFIHGDIESYTDTHASDIATFRNEFPTPFDFEEPANKFLHERNYEDGEARAQEYNVAMADLCGKIYGKRYEYYETMKALDREVQSYELKAYNEALKNVTELPIADAGVCTINKANLDGENGRANEDAYYCNKGRSTFGVFDGAGGMGGAALASDAAVNRMGLYVDNYDIKTPEDIRKMLVLANDTVRDTLGAETTTGAVGKMVKENDTKKLLYGCVGDSRIYIIRDGDAIQVTQDEDNCLGRQQASVQQFGERELADGDKILFCSNGVTGSDPSDSLPTKEIAMMVLNASGAEDAAKNLVERATKNDDRTAIVVEI